MHLAGIEIGGMTEGTDCGFLAGNDVGHLTAFVAEIGMLQRVLNLPRGSKGFAPLNEIVTDFSKPHVRQRIL